MSVGIPQTGFSRGELAPSLYGKVDFAGYYTALKTCRNFIVRQYGGITNRPGTHLVTELYDSSKAGVLIPFEFSAYQSYVLEFGDYVMRIMKDGGVVVWPSGPSVGLPVEVVTPYPVAALPLLKYVQSADVMSLVHPNYPPQKLVRTDHHLWTMSEDVTTDGPFKDINVDDTITVIASGVTGSITLTSNADLFLASHVGMLFYLEQAPDGLTPKWEVQKSVAINNIKRAGMNYYIARNAGTTGTVRPTTLDGIEYDGDPGIAWEYIHSGFGIVKITGYTDARHVSATVTKRLPENTVTGTMYRSIQSATSGSPYVPPVDPNPEVPAVNATVRCDAHGFSSGDNIIIAGVTAGLNGTWGIIVTDVNNYQLSGCYGDATGYVSGGSATKSLSAVPSYRWAFGAWGGPNLYPGAVGYTQERRVFGGSATDPQTFWMSRSQGYSDFGKSIPLLDDDSISYKINSRKVTEIRHFIELSEFIILTSDGPFLIRGDQSGVIKPGGISRKKQSSSGAAHIAPVVIDSYALYVQEKGSQVRSLGYSFQDDAFVGKDITIQSHHLFRGRTIVSWCYQQTPFANVWVVLDNGALLSLTYMPEQDVVGWSRHDTDGFFESVVCITENGKDVVYFQVRREFERTTRRFIERLADRIYEDPRDAYFMDCGLSYNGAPITHVSGLDHLEGKTVSILADGNVHAQRIVTNGSITLDRESSVVHVGLPYVSDFETLEIASAQQNIRDKEKIINYVHLMVEESRGVKVGPDADHLLEAKRDEYKNYEDAINETTGLIDIRIQATWNKKGQVFGRQSDPLPLTILSITPEVTNGGS